MIGILGGTFDPIHKGHIEIARSIQNSFRLSELYLLPSFIPPHRSQPGASATERLAMLDLAIADEPHLKIDARELKRTGVSYTIDSLREIRQEIGPNESLIFILGIDAFNQLTQWKDWSHLLDFCHFVVINRPNYDLVADAELKALLSTHQSFKAEELATQAAGLIYLQNITPLDYSATAIRTQGVTTGLPRVDQFIKHHQLYRKSMTLTELNQLIQETLEEAKALNITQIDVTGMTDVCDSIFICTATSSRHGRSIETKLLEATRLHAVRPLGTEKGEDESWILVDLNLAVVHIMTEETRRFYNLEQLWDLTNSSREKHAH